MASDDPILAQNKWILREFRENNGQVGGEFDGAPILLLHTMGAKSGQPRETPLMCWHEDGRT